MGCGQHQHLSTRTRELRAGGGLVSWVAAAAAAAAAVLCLQLAGLAAALLQLPLCPVAAGCWCVAVAAAASASAASAASASAASASAAAAPAVASPSCCCLSFFLLPLLHRRSPCSRSASLQLLLIWCCCWEGRADLTQTDKSVRHQRRWLVLGLCFGAPWAKKRRGDLKSPAACRRRIFASSV